MTMTPFSQSNQVVVYVFEKGYRVLLNGDVLSPHNTKRKTAFRKGYVSFNIRYEGKSIPVLVHKLCAFQKYGFMALACDCIRHLDGNSVNNALDNICIGSFSENQMDKPTQERKREATIASHSYAMRWDEKDVEQIKAYHKKSCSYFETMKHFGISSKGTLHFILNNR